MHADFSGTLGACRLFRDPDRTETVDDGGLDGVGAAIIGDGDRLSSRRHADQVTNNPQTTPITPSPTAKLKIFRHGW